MFVKKEHTKREVRNEVQVVTWTGNLDKVIGDLYIVELQTFSLVDCPDYEIWNETANIGNNVTTVH